LKALHGLTIHEAVSGAADLGNASYTEEAFDLGGVTNELSG